MNTTLLLNQWINVTARYSTNENMCRNIFNELIAHYTESNRHYHTLTHINTMLADIATCYPDSIPDELFLAAWFHDAIYNTMIGNNEAQSAALAVSRLQQLQVPAKTISLVESLILKTANHLSAIAPDEACRLFLDIDLKILGADKATYHAYTQDVRKEFAIYPNLVFNRGRKAFIEKALAAERIYKSEKFFNLYEQLARKNLQNELNILL